MSSTARRLLRDCLLLTWLVCPWAMADDTAAFIAVIANGEFAQDALEPAELAAIFRRTEIIDQRGQPLVPVNLPGHDGLRLAFSRALFNLEPAEMEAYWNERYFHGVAPPHVVASVEAMLRFVAATDGAVGYVPLCAVDGRVKVVARLPARSAARNALTCAAPSLPKLQTEIAH
jgi:hypothetical protein